MRRGRRGVKKKEVGGGGWQESTQAFSVELHLRANITASVFRSVERRIS